MIVKLFRKIRNFFLPHEENNQKAKILHNSSLFVLAVGLALLEIIFTFIPKTPVGRVLGYAANISPSEVIRLTNERRIAQGLNPLTENGILSSAALAKGTDMLNKGYWAHVSPDGTQPWAFFINSGYKYRYAGENLARDFSNPSSTVDAWMASPSHRDNLLSAKYREIGVGVVEGSLDGVDTTIVVQFFGTSYADTITAPVAQISPSPSPTSVTSAVEATATGSTQKELPVFKATEANIVNQEVLISPFTTSRGISIAVVGILLVIMIIDAALVSRRRIVRIGGRTFAHLSFLGMILAIAIILRAGQIL